MTTDALTIAEALDFHLTYVPPSAGMHRWSAFMAALRDARLVTGRSPETGEKLPDQLSRHGSWLGALGYMALLDHIGNCFRPKGRMRLVIRKKGGPIPGIEKALRYFSGLDRRHIDAIYALRCAFAHDYSLFNTSKTATLRHHFLVTANGGREVVKLPRRRWDGDCSTRRKSNRTVVDLQALGDLVETIYGRLLTLKHANHLMIELSDGPDELRAKYSYSSE